MNNNYCDSCGTPVMTSIRVCPSCGNRSFSATPPSKPVNSPSLVSSSAPVVNPSVVNQTVFNAAITGTTASNRGVNTSHPIASFWSRVWARSIDLVLASVAGVILGILMPSVIIFNSGLANFLVDTVVCSILVCISILLYDTLLLSTWGTTPGKALMGLIVRNSSGNKLTVQLAQRRAWIMLGSGLAYTLWFPFLQLINLFLLAKKTSMRWDGSEYGLVLQAPIGDFRRAVVILFSIILMLFFMSLNVAGNYMYRQELKRELKKNYTSVSAPVTYCELKNRGEAHEFS